MATFGPIASPAPNILFNPLAVDQQVAGMQRNRLLMQQATEDRQLAKVDREREEVGRVSASLLSLDPAARPQAYSAAVSELQRNGLALQAPGQYPGDGRIEQMARAALPAQAQFQLAEKQRASQEMSALLGGMLGMGGGGPSMPGGQKGGQYPGAISPSALTAPTVASVPQRDYAAGEAARAATLDAPPEVLAQASANRSTVPEIPGGYRAPAGVGGAFQGLAPPTGTINPNVGGGLSPMEGAALMMGARGNPAALPGLMLGIQGQRAAQVERATDNQRADRGLAIQQEREARMASAQERVAQAQTAGEERRARADVARLEAEEKRLGLEERRVAATEARANAPPSAATATEGERKAAGYLERMQGAESLLQNMVRGGYDPGNIRDRIAGSTPGVGNFMTSERGQQYLNAGAEWARAKLRLESGAVIGEEEAKAEARTYFPMPGDSPATIAQKQQMRETAVSAIRRQAGRAAPEGQAAPAAAPQRLRFNPATGRIE